MLSISRKVSNSQQTEDLNKCGGVGELKNPHLKMRFMTVSHMPTLKTNSFNLYEKIPQADRNE